MSRIRKQDYFKNFKNQSHIEQMEKIKRKFEAVHNVATNTTELTIYGIIGDSYWEDSVSASDIDNALKGITGDIIIHLNSPGGDAFDGIAIYNRLKKHDGKVTINVDGFAASAASVIAMAADELNMGLGSMLMIHEASTIVWGTKSAMRKQANVLDELEEGLIDIYMTKANVTREEIRAAVDAETWFSAQKAVEIGFANKATSDDDKEAVITQLRNKLAQANNQIEQLMVNQVTPEVVQSETKTISFMF
ncbi:Clp protease ClpP [Paenibacillus glycanilyticus]|uniref:head maturation protease, ClpP-related n=1 Tax=Paenibacillus glycanilyticus TaxID=126569 RepID=UPI00203C3445|nr:head maturation protease, ClpP-related [Paenibacillus glycanilyticus]MCM3628797.1 Clp protease ClpP [Paenibacillus glycanilyticus]